MKITKLFSLLALSMLFILEGCSPWTKVYSEEEPGINLHKYHTFNWLDNTTAKQGNSGPEWLTAGTQAKIRAAFEEQLNRYSFKPCTEKPDLLLHYHVVIKNEVLYVLDRSCEGQGGDVYGRCNRVRPMQYREGTLIIDFIDSQSGNQVWRGAVVGVLENIQVSEVDARIKAAAEAIFKKFPENPIPVATL